MIEIASPKPPQRNPFLPMVVRQRQWPLLEADPQTSSKLLANSAAAPNHISMSAEDAPSLHAIHPNHLRSSLRPRLN